MSSFSTERDAVAYLRSTKAIRERCGALYELGRCGKLNHFLLDESRLNDVVSRVKDELLTNYPDLNVPYHSRWRHFDAEGVDRLSMLNVKFQGLSLGEVAAAKLELAIVSVLLDAGAGSEWKYTERPSGVVTSKSEGLAVASLYSYVDGIFGDECTVTAQGLRALTTSQLKAAFQVSAENPLVGTEGRVALLNQLGEVVSLRPDIFGADKPRLGGIFSALVSRATGGRIDATAVLDVVLSLLSPIWPGRVSLAGENLGDVWRHSQLSTTDCSSQLVPFHKLSQWLTYSLFEPLEESGLEVVGVDELTGLAEYRNGGLFIDAGVLVPKDPAVFDTKLSPSSEVVVEWRALTVSLLDRVADALRNTLGKNRTELPLAKVLQGGTWSAGRKIAKEKRASGAPPLAIESDGTVF